MIRTHISIPEDIDRIIKDYCINNNVRYSQAVAKLIKLGIKNKELSELVNTNNNLMHKMYSKLAYSVSLTEQLYSDMEIEKITNPNTNKALNEFKYKKNRNNDD